MRKGKLELGMSNFDVVRQEKLYYIDKSLFILHILQADHRALLIPRPRRFGKTMNMTMLKAFFEKSSTDATPWFQDLAIWQEPEARPHFQRYPVLYISFKDCKGLDWPQAFAMISDKIWQMVELHRELLNIPALLSPREFQTLEKAVYGRSNQNDLATLIPTLCSALHRHYGQQVVLLIDEYDTPIHHALARGYYDQAINFFKTFLGTGLKDNPSLFRGVLTGILRVSKENMFSDLNNVGVYSFLRDEFAADFGLTESEVSQLLQDQGVPELLDGVRDMYNGYLFGETHPVAIYNPWSTLSCVANVAHTLEPYWNKTGSTELLDELVLLHGDKIVPQLESLLHGDGIEAVISDNVALLELRQDPNQLFGFMLFTGYLKATQRDLLDDQWRVKLTLVNRELHGVVRKLYHNWLYAGLEMSRERVLAFCRALLAGDVARVQADLSLILLNIASFMDGSGRTPEKFYHGLVLGLLVVLEPHYRVRSNREAGLGRVDVQITPRTPGNPGVVLELKVVRAGQTLHEALLTALDQLESLHYAAELEAQGVAPIQRLGVAFDGKTVVVASQAQRSEVLARAHQEREVLNPPAFSARSEEIFRSDRRPQPLLSLDERLELAQLLLTFAQTGDQLVACLAAGIEVSTVPSPLGQWLLILQQAELAGKSNLRTLLKALTLERPALATLTLVQTLSARLS